jgi:uncharacterized RDD family membrane protein YckC
MSSAAQRDETVEQYPPVESEGRSALKQIAAERLAAHRNRRAVVENREVQIKREQAAAQAAVRLQAQREGIRAEARPNASRVKEAVAAHYQQSLSYREFLAAEAQRAMEQAQAEAEVAARSAVAVADAQRKLLAEIEQWNQTGQDASTQAVRSTETLAFFEDVPLLEVVDAQPVVKERAKRVRQEEMATPAVAYAPAPLQVRMHSEMEATSSLPSFYVPSRRAPAAFEELAELDDEIAFRRAPEFEDLVMDTQALQANIIEFPRQLVASRKARPRLAEGPLREDGTPEPQLRIFEVEAEQISLEPEAATANDAPEWQGLLLNDRRGARPDVSMSPQLEAQLQLDRSIYAAPLSSRMAALAVDGLCVGAGLAAFVAVVMKVAGELLRGTPLPMLGAAAAGALLVFIVLYQFLFFTLNEVTPGMRAAHLAFCTFNEKSPTRKALRRRMISTALAACPLGLGLVWTALDSDRLGWHDRMSRMYPRSY